MPTYNMRCVKCDKTFEIVIPITEKHDAICPYCQSNKLVTLISKNIWVKYTGSGFTKKVKPDK